MTLQFMKPDGTGVRTLTPSGNPRPFLDQIAWTASDEALLATGGGSSRQNPAHSNVRRPRGTGDERRPRLLGSLVFPGVRRHRDRADHATRVDLDWAGASSGRGPGGAKPARRVDGAEGLSWLNDCELVFNRTVSNLSTLWTMQADGGGARQLAQGSLAIATDPRADRGGRHGVVQRHPRGRGPPGSLSADLARRPRHAGHARERCDGREFFRRGHGVLPAVRHQDTTRRRSCGWPRTVLPRRGSSKRR